MDLYSVSLFNHRIIILNMYFTYTCHCGYYNVYIDFLDFKILNGTHS